MSASILFDSPGPHTRMRHRIYSAVAVLALIALVALVVRRLQDKGALANIYWEPFYTTSFVQALLKGLLQTLEMAALSVVLAVVFGVLLGVAKLSDHRWVRGPAWLVVEFFRAVPVLLLMVFLFQAYSVGPGGIAPFWCVVLALTLYNGSVLAEVFRAGINAVPPGQAEAAYAIGMRKSQVMNIVLLPQAVKIMIPSIISQCVVTLKDTSLGYYITAPGLTFVGKQIFNQFHNQLQTAIVVATMYIIVNMVLSAIATLAQKKFVGEKRLEVPAVGQDGGGGAP